tara:strand:- start:17 stop:205 length:189 start_codon:yes stop_codon:yes gene_type:complete
MKIVQKVVRFCMAIPMLPTMLLGGVFFSLLRYAMDGSVEDFSILKEYVIVLLKWLVFIDADM